VRLICTNSDGVGSHRGTMVPWMYFPLPVSTNSKLCNSHR